MSSLECLFCQTHSLNAHTHSRTHTQAYKPPHTHTQSRTHTRNHSHTHTQTHAGMHTTPRTHTHTHKHKCIPHKHSEYTDTHKNKQTHTHTHAYQTNMLRRKLKHTHTPTTYTCLQERPSACDRHASGYKRSDWDKDWCHVAIRKQNGLVIPAIHHHRSAASRSSRRPDTARWLGHHQPHKALMLLDQGLCNTSITEPKSCLVDKTLDKYND